jgi:tRNA pseudouridine65 synthase
MSLLRNQVGQYVYPAHRLDRATSGVVIYALNSEIASAVNQQFRSQTVQKKYYAVVRGTPPSELLIDYPLKNDSGTEVPSVTQIYTLQTVELTFPNRRFQTSRFSLIQARPKSGSYHQIRRHLKHHHYPIIGDRIYGDGIQNRIFSENLKIQNLLLRAFEISFFHPVLNQTLTVRTRWNHLWHRVFDVFGFCPYDPSL